MLNPVGSISGEAGKEQRRFALRNLRDFGFGKSGAEEIIREEFLDMADNLRGVEGQGGHSTALKRAKKSQFWPENLWPENSPKVPF